MAETLGKVSLSVAPILPGAAAATSPAIELAQQPPAALLLAATLAAVVVGRGGNGALLLRTDYGTLALKTALALPAGSRVTLKLLPGPPATVILLSVETANGGDGGADSLPPALVGPPPLAGGKPDAASAMAASYVVEEPPAQLTLGSEIEATVTTPSPDTVAGPPVGTRLVLRVMLPVGDAPPPSIPASAAPALPRFAGTVAATPPEMAGRTILDTPLGALALDRRLALPPGTVVDLTPIAISPPPVASSPLAAATVVSARVLPAPPGEPAPALPPGTRLELRIQLLPEPPSPELAGAPSPEGAAFAGTVLSAGSSETVIQTPIGKLAVARRLAVPQGTLVTLEQLASAPPDEAPDLPLAQRPTWPALEETLATLDRALPELAMRLRADLSPASGQELAGTLLFLMSALNNSAWPGTKITAALDLAGRRDLRAKLEGDVAELRQLAEPQSGDWRIYVLPLLDGMAVRPVRLYFRRRPRGGAADEQGTRFVLEVEMTRIGALQLDGLVRPQRFDLVLRSHRAILAELRQEIATVFRNAIAASGLSGDISFATALRFTVAPLEALAGHVGVTA
jgi:hypothetical protein